MASSFVNYPLPGGFIGSGGRIQGPAGRASSTVQRDARQKRRRVLTGWGFLLTSYAFVFFVSAQGIPDDEFAHRLIGSPGWEGLHWAFRSHSLHVQKAIRLQCLRQMGIFQTAPGRGRTKMQLDRLILSWAGKLLQAQVPYFGQSPRPGLGDNSYIFFSLLETATQANLNTAVMPFVLWGKGEQFLHCHHHHLD